VAVHKYNEVNAMSDIPIWRASMDGGLSVKTLIAPRAPSPTKAKKLIPIRKVGWQVYDDI
jgi:hypothetical protein